MKNRKTISMIIARVILVCILAFSVYADLEYDPDQTYARAKRMYAESHIVCYEENDLLAVARLGNSLGWTGDSFEGWYTSLHAYGYESYLVGYPDVPTQVSRAYAWIGEEIIVEDYWVKED
ncbi:MAG: hypothetical protein PUE85_06975 [Firmicutes bacterium]|nr:hypothetical protein [Bacillota bacterium]